jgi:hypothetical protein
VVSDQNATFNGFVTAGANMLSANDRAGKESMHFYSPQGGTSIIIGSFES